MAYAINMTETAKNDLRDIALYIAKESGEPEVAIKFITELQQCCKALEEFPNTGAFPKDRFLIALGYRYLVHKEYLIFYTIEEQQVNIVAFFNAKKDYMRVLKI